MHLTHNTICGMSYYFLYDGETQLGKCIVRKGGGGNSVTLDYITILPKFRGNGYSTVLWELLETQLKKLGVDTVLMDAHELDTKHGKLVKLYQTWGFELNGVGKYGYNGDALERIVSMVKRLP